MSIRVRGTVHGPIGPPMKKFFSRYRLSRTGGLSGWLVGNNHLPAPEVADLRGEIAQLEQQRRDLQRQVTSTVRGFETRRKDGGPPAD